MDNQEIIYTLQLENGKYYVGKSKNIQNRILQHFSEAGSSWTKSYKPVKVLSQVPSLDPFDEEKYTLLAMDRWGIDNVRGGSYCKLILSKHEMEKAQQIIYSVCDKCYRCGENKHTASECDDIKISIVLKFLMDVKIDGLSKDKSRKLISKCAEFKCITCVFIRENETTDNIEQYNQINFIDLYKNLNKINNKDAQGIIIHKESKINIGEKNMDFSDLLELVWYNYASLVLVFK